MGLVGAAGLEGALRAKGHLASWSEENGGPYVSPYAYRSSEPWLHVGPAASVTSMTQPEFTFEMRLNTEGVRDRDHPHEKPPGEYRILALGDSFTAGQGAAFEDSWTVLLERELRAEGRPVRVLSAGYPGSDPVFCYQLLARRMIHYDPNLVLLVVNESDIFDIITRGGMDRFGPDGHVIPPERPAIEGLYARSYLVRAVIRSRIFRYEWDLRLPAEHARRSAAALETIAEAARASRELLAPRGAQLVVVTHPFDYLIFDPAARDKLAPLAPLLAAAGIEHLDLVAFLRAEVPPERAGEIVWPLDRHHNAAGYALFGEGVRRYLVERPGFPRVQMF